MGKDDSIIFFQPFLFRLLIRMSLWCAQPNSPLCVPTFFVEVKPIPDRHEVYLWRRICDSFITKTELHFRKLFD